MAVFLGIYEMYVILAVPKYSPMQLSDGRLDKMG